MAAGWNFADLWEAIADHLPDAQATVHDRVSQPWSAFDREADRIGAARLAHGVEQGSTFAQYLYNGPEYLAAVFGAFKVGVAPVNTNYRYVDDELVYLWDNADTQAVIFHGEFTERIAGIRSRVPGVRLWLFVDDGNGPCPDWAVDLASLPAAERTRSPWGRSGDDLYLLYTGGTTGMPKGVMWRQDDLLVVLNAGAPKSRWLPEQPDLAAVPSIITSPGFVTLPACPLMHGTGAFNAFTALSIGGSVATLANRRFDPVELLDTIEREGVGNVAIVGDAFARPLLAALRAEPGRWDLSSLRVILSSGVMWSQETKDGLLEFAPRAMLVDSLGSSEAIGMGSSVSTAGEAVATASFSLGEHTKVITDDGRELAPGDDEIGRVAIKGRTPIGYYKDEAKSASTFLTIDGVRFSVPGDYARVAPDGTLQLLGRGSVCINTGGEKVFPEEVEEALKSHPGVRDAVVVGVPDERFGERIVAVVAGDATDADLVEHVRNRLAAYKQPRAILHVDDLGRAANGKVDYKRWKQFATEG